MKRRPFRPYLYDAAPADIRRTARAVGIDPHHWAEFLAHVDGLSLSARSAAALASRDTAFAVVLTREYHLETWLDKVLS